MKNIILALRDSEQFVKYREILTSRGYNIAECVNDGIDLVLACRELKPDMVIADISMAYYASAEEFLIQNNTLMLFCLADEVSETLMQKVGEGSLAGCLISPVEEKDLVPALAAAFTHHEKMEKLRLSYEEIEKQIDSQRIIEKAKNIIMQEKNISPKEAEEQLMLISKAKKLEIIETAKILTNTK